MDKVIEIGLDLIGIFLIGYVGYFIGHTEGFRKGLNLQRRIDRNEL